MYILKYKMNDQEYQTPFNNLSQALITAQEIMTINQVENINIEYSKQKRTIPLLPEK